MMIDSFLSVNPNPHCLVILKAFFVKMQISPGWLKQNIFLKIKNASQNISKIFFTSGVSHKNLIFNVFLMII
jgi:hypothetical protein